jgi:DNA integrity scanning protein DisA with diadenylate cyclase activity
LAGLRLSDLVDIAIVATLIWVGIVWLSASRARMGVLGLSAIAALFLLARGLDLELTKMLLQGFFAVAALVLVVVFQDDLRRLFEGIAVWGLRRAAPHAPPDVEQALVRVAFRLAQAKIGALIILPGREPLERHLDGGIYLDGRCSEPLLQSLFDPGSPGHDGAIVVRANKVVRFGVHLPLSTDWDRIGPGGTRHAAALGLAERSDAFCIVVSEERGEVSLAHAGCIDGVDTPEELAGRLHDFIGRFARQAAPQGAAEWVARIRSRWREGAVALAVAMGLWYVAVPGAAIEMAEREVPVVVENLPDGYRLVAVEPAEVNVRFEGRRRDLVLAGGGELSVRIDAFLAQLGRRTFQISIDQVRSPEAIRAVGIDPERVRIVVEREAS